MIGIIKNLVFTTILTIFFLTGARSQSVKYTTNLPETMKSGDSYDVEVTIIKGGLNSFAKFQMDLPAGFNASPLEIKGGSWTFDQQRAKIVWVSIPGDPNFKIKFKINATKVNVASALINSKLFYLENGVKQEFELPAHNISFSGITNSNNDSKTITNDTSSNKNSEETNINKNKNDDSNAKKETETNSEKKTNNSSENTVVTKNEQAKKEDVGTEKKSENPKSTESNNIKTIYRLQIGAFASKPDKAKYKQYKDFWYYEESGLFKVTIGKFSTLNEAEEFKKQMKEKGTDGFVVSFDNNVHVKIH